jgi:hypothetical protein
MPCNDFNGNAQKQQAIVLRKGLPGFKKREHYIVIIYFDPKSDNGVGRTRDIIPVII